MAVVLVVILVVLVVTKKRGPQGASSSSFSSSLGFLFTRVQFASRWLVGWVRGDEKWLGQGGAGRGSGFFGERKMKEIETYRDTERYGDRENKTNHQEFCGASLSFVPSSSFFLQHRHRRPGQLNG